MVALSWRAAVRPLQRSLRTKLIAWFFIPTAIILVAVALVTFYSSQEVTEKLVVERDEDVTRLSASRLASSLAEYVDLLSGLTRSSDMSRADPDAQQAALSRSRSQLVVFDGGVVVLDASGKVVATEPKMPAILGQDWSASDHFRQVRRSPVPLFSDAHSLGPGTEAVVAAVPVLGENNEFLGSLIGIFRLQAESASAFYGGIVKLRLGRQGRTYLVDANGRVIFHSDSTQIGVDFSGQPVVQQVLASQTGAVRTKDFGGVEIVAGFAPVPGTPWGLVTEESWESLTADSRTYRSFVFILLALARIHRRTPMDGVRAAEGGRWEAGGRSSVAAQGP